MPKASERSVCLATIKSQWDFCMSETCSYEAEGRTRFASCLVDWVLALVSGQFPDFGGSSHTTRMLRRAAKDGESIRPASAQMLV